MGQLHKKEPTGKNANTKESPVGWAFQKIIEHEQEIYVM